MDLAAKSPVTGNPQARESNLSVQAATLQGTSVNQPHFRKHHVPFLLAVGILIVAASNPTAAQPLQIRLDMTGGYLTNTYLDDSQLSDLVLSPQGLVIFYPVGWWSLSYRGRLDWYEELEELTTHGHEAYTQIAKHWVNELDLLREVWVRLGLQSLFNSEELEALNHLTPQLLLGGTVDLHEMVSLAPVLEVNYRNFFDDPDESQLNTYACGQLGVHLPSRTTILVRPCYGFRWYFTEAGFLSDAQSVTQLEGANQDAHQVELRLRLAQNLAQRLGLRLEYLGRVVPRRAERAESLEAIGVLRSDLTGDFRYLRHRPSLRLSWLATDFLMAVFDAAYERREYDGIQALTYGPGGTIVRTEGERNDDRLVLGTLLETRWRPVEELRFTFGLQYRFIQIWSTSDIYTSPSHEVSVSVGADWTP